MKKSVSALTILCIILSVVFAALTLAAWLVFLPRYKSRHFTAAAPSNLQTVAASEPKAAYGDFYVSPNGNDSSNGSLEHPFRTIGAAQKAARKMDKQYLSHVVVSIMSGTYQTKGLKFTKADSGTDSCSIIYCAYGDGEVIFDGGVNAEEQTESDSTALITIEGASYFSLSGVSIANAGGNGLTVTGSNINIDSCTVRQVAGRGISCKGSKISITACQISNTGAEGVAINGGDVKTLKASENTVDNTLISYTSRRNTAAPSLSVNGVGAVVSHNEIINSPAAAIYYMGCNHRIEGNYIHNTVLADCEQAAIDSPFFRWDCRGNTVRRNCLNLIGSKTANGSFIGIRPCSGTEVTQNLLLNICGEKAAGVLLSGCRSVTLTNNIFVNTGEGVTGTDYPEEHAKEAAEQLKNSAYQSDAWKKAFPACAGLSTDPQSENYAALPADNRISNNISMQKNGSLGDFSAAFKKGAAIEENAQFLPGKPNVFTDPDGGNYTVENHSAVYRSMKEFKNIPFEEIGRY